MKEAIIGGGLARAFPGRQWSFDPTKNDVDDIVWHDGPAPERGEILAALAGNPVKESIEAIEVEQRRAVSARADREFRIGVFEALAALQAQANGTPLPAALAALRSKNKGYRELKALDDQIAALRAQL